MSAEKKTFSLSENEWQIVLDSLSNTIFNEELAEDTRKNTRDVL